MPVRIEAAAGADTFPVGGYVPDAIGGEQRRAWALAHGQCAVPAGDHGCHGRPSCTKGGYHDRRADRENGHAHESAGLLYALLPGPGAGDTADTRHGAGVQQRLSRSYAAGYTGAAGACGYQEPVQREHHLEKELPRRPCHHHWGQQRGGPAYAAYQGDTGGRGRRLPSQRRDRGRPSPAGTEAADDLLGQKDNHCLYTYHQGAQPH